MSSEPTRPHPDHHSDGHDSDGHGPEGHDLGLSHDLVRIAEHRRAALGRRGLLTVLGGIGAVAVVGCAADDPPGPTASATNPSASRGAAGAPPAAGGQGSAVDVADGEIPEETAGPYPGDGSNGVNVLTESGVVRSDITSSFGSASGVAAGVPTTVRLKVYDLDGDDATALAGAAIYLWHCDRDGEYSMYSESIAEENYLRGVQETDRDGWVEFTTIFPAAYSGRWPHMHFEVYESLAAATGAERKLRTSQLAIPEATAREVYANAEGYAASVATLEQTSLSDDMVFSDGYSLQMAKVSGSLADGYVLTLNVPV
ncbi:3,4-dioxygenase subunit beta [Nocardioides dongxiaopingii]|uniref:dioxygenase family protein n=1 Tax=Nocardioides sp. S-1144 TaxID=2582905 RepID=UPI00110D7F87|nr:3,4-dioxygenase subunit beta [Nocardioides sp. S-1144]QCW50602.1 3,4-dioxygenase subunit beta [Nocardioides sp. S-1144]